MSKFLIPNTTQVPNILLDAVIPKLPPGAVRVLLAIVRKTNGFQKSSDRISYSQLQSLTGLSRQGVSSGTKVLGALLKIKPGKKGKGANEYSLNLDVTTGQLVNKVDQPNNLTSQSCEQKVVKKVDSPKPIRQNQDNGCFTPPSGISNPDEIPSHKFLELYASCAPSLPQPREVTNGRLRKIRQRLKTHPAREFWQDVFSKANQTPFLKGENDRGWKASLDWFVKNDENAVMVLEGKYDRGVQEETGGSKYRDFDAEQEALNGN